MHFVQIWPPGGATCIATLPRIAQMAFSVSIDLALFAFGKGGGGRICLTQKYDKAPIPALESGHRAGSWCVESRKGQQAAPAAPLLLPHVYDIFLGEGA